MLQLLNKIKLVLTPAEKRELRTFLILGLIISLLDIASLGLIVWLINAYSGTRQGNNHMATYFMQHGIVVIAIGVILLFAFKNVAGYLISQAQFRFNYNIATRLSRAKLLQYLRTDYFSYINTDSSVYMYRIAQQPIEFSQYILSGYQQTIVQGVLIALSIAAMALYNVRIFFMLVILLLPPMLIVAYFIKTKLKAARQNTRKNSEKSLQYLKESLSAYVECHIFNKRTFFSDRYTQYQQRLNTGLANLQSIQLLPSRLFETFAVAGILILMIISSSLGKAVINLTTISLFMAAAYKIIPGLVKIITNLGQIKAYEHVFENLGTLPEQAAYQNRNGKLTLDYIFFKGVSFRYHNKTLFNDLNFSLKPGDFAGLSGTSGRGKTSLINILLGFLNPLNGEILFNTAVTDMEIRMMYHSRISYVKQTTLLIHDSIRNNIVLSENECDEGRLQAALAFTGLDEIIAGYQDGIHKLVTENGSNISGGQRQRIMLARALYKSFDLLILDEPFNELDEASEIGILGNLQQLARQGKMVLLITHNQHSLTYCNKALLLNNRPVPYEA